MVAVDGVAAAGVAAAGVAVVGVVVAGVVDGKFLYVNFYVKRKNHCLFFRGGGYYGKFRL